jgi:DNA polymerase III gamma/tau subunit
MEGREAEEGLLERVAAYGRGGLRDAQTLLDQLMTFDEGELRVEALDRVTGRVPAKLAGLLMESVLGRNPARALECFRESLTLGADPGMVIEQLVADFRGRVHEIVAVGDEKGARSDASPSSLDRHLGALQILLDTAGKLRHSAYPDVAVEIAILKVTRLEEPADLEEVIRSLREMAASGDAATPGVLRSQGDVGTAPQRRDGAVDRRPTVEDLGRQLGEASPPRSDRSPDISAAQEPRSEDRRPRAAAASDVEGMRQAAIVGETAVVAVAPDPVEEASSSGAAVQDEPGYDFGALNELWDQIRIELESKHPDIAPFFKEVRPEPAQGVTDTVRLRFPDEFFQRQMKASGRQQVLEDVVRAVTATPWKFLMEHLPPGVEVTSIGGVGPTRLQAPPAPTVEKATSTEQAPPARSSRPQSARAPSSRPQDPRTGGIQARPDSNIAPAVEDGGDASEESRTPGATTPQGGGRPGGDGIAKDPIVLKSIDLFKGRIV